MSLLHLLQYREAADFWFEVPGASTTWGCTNIFYDDPAIDYDYPIMYDGWPTWTRQTEATTTWTQV